MKNIYLSTIALAMSSLSFSQNGITNTQRLMQRADNGSMIQATTPLTEKGITLWSNDCSNAADWTFTHTTGAGFHSIDWYKETALATPAGLGDFASTTANNGFLMINSDANNSADADGTTIQADATIATPIDLTGEPNVILSFEHNFRWWQDIRQVNVSGNNGATWTTFDVSDATGNLTGLMDQNSGNPEVTTFDISAVAGGSNQVLIQFHYDDQDFWSWYWAVDDVKITRQDPDDLVASQPYFGSQGLPYFSIPATQIAPIDFSIIAKNVGYSNQTNSVLTVDVNSGTYTETSPTGVDIITQTQDTLIAQTQFTPPNIGTYNISYSVVSDNIDATPSDNIGSDAFQVVSDGDYNSDYNRDRGVYTGQGGGVDNANGTDYAFEAGNLFDIFTTQPIMLMKTVVGSNTPAGTIIYGKIYELDQQGNFNYLDETAEYTTTQADADNNIAIALAFFTLPTLTAGSTYLVVVGCYSEFYFGTSGESADNTSFIMYGGVGGAGSQYYTNETPMVRLNTYMGAIEENKATNLVLKQNSPNPFNNTTTINYTLKTSGAVSLQITDLTGKVIQTLNEGTKAVGDYSITLDGSELAEGMYYYTLSNGETSSTKNMTIVK